MITQKLIFVILLVYYLIMKKILIPFLFLMCTQAFADIWTPKKPDYSDYLRSWFGINADQLIMYWGNPSSVGELSTGEIVFEYDEHIQTTTSGTYVPGSVTTTSSVDTKGTVTYSQTINDGYYKAPETYNYKAWVIFTINKSNNICAYSYDGQIGALNNMISKRTCPYFNETTYYLEQYRIKASEWVGYTAEDLNDIYPDKGGTDKPKTSTKYVVTSPKDEKTFIVFNLDNAGEKIESVEVEGDYKKLETLYASPLEIFQTEINPTIYAGAGLVVFPEIEPRALSLNGALKIDLAYGFKFATGLNLLIGKEMFTGSFDITPLDYYVIRKEDFNLHLGLSFLLGYYSHEKDNGFSFREQMFVAAQWRSFDLSYNFSLANTYLPMRFASEIRLNYMFKPDLYKLYKTK